MNKYLKTYIRNRSIILQYHINTSAKGLKGFEIEYFKDREYYLNNLGIANILSNEPEFINYFKYRLNDLNFYDITDILLKQPQLIDFFKNRLRELDDYCISKILNKQPELSKYFNSYE